MAGGRWLAVAVCPAVLWAASGCDRAPEDNQPRPVRAIRLAADTADVCRTYFGVSRPVQEAALSFRVGGPLAKLPAEMGRRVARGDMLAQVDPRDYERSIELLGGLPKMLKAELRLMKAGAREEVVRALEAQLGGARATLEEAQLQYQRARNLREDDSVPQARLDSAVAARDAAAANVEALEQKLLEARAGARAEEIEAQEARIESAEARIAEAMDALSDTRLTAPFDGRVAAVYVENYQTVSPGTPVARLVDLSRVEVAVGLPAEMVIRRDSFRSIVCRFDACPGMSWPGRITEVSPEATRQTQTYEVTIVVDQQPGCEVLSGMPASVEILMTPLAEPEPGFVVPTQAVVSQRPGRAGVWVVDENSMRVHRREVALGAPADDMIRIVEGVQAGELIVTAGASYLTEGQEVRLLEEAGAAR